MDKQKRTFTTESGKMVEKALIENNYNNFSDNDVIAFSFEEHGKTGYVLYNFTSTKIKFDLNDICLSDLERDGIKIWRTWTWGENIKHYD